MKIFITADHHFHHKNIIEYCKRPFKTVEEMDKVMIEKWNRKVGKDDLVIHLGDFAIGSKTKIKETKDRLNGTIVLIKGNHDKIIKEFIVVKDSLRIGNFIFSHRPIPKKEIPKGFINVHGHIHEKESLEGINLSVEQTNYEPVLLEEIESMIKDKKSERSENKIK